MTVAPPPAGHGAARRGRGSPGTAACCPLGAGARVVGLDPDTALVVDDLPPPLAAMLDELGRPARTAELVAAAAARGVPAAVTRELLAQLVDAGALVDAASRASGRPGPGRAVRQRARAAVRSPSARHRPAARRGRHGAHRHRRRRCSAPTSAPGTPRPTGAASGWPPPRPRCGGSCPSAGTRAAAAAVVPGSRRARRRAAPEPALGRRAARPRPRPPRRAAARRHRRRRPAGAARAARPAWAAWTCTRGASTPAGPPWPPSWPGARARPTRPPSPPRSALAVAQALAAARRPVDGGAHPRARRHARAATSGAGEPAARPHLERRIPDVPVRRRHVECDASRRSRERGHNHEA